MRIKLYTNIFEDQKDANLSYLDLYIKGKMVNYCIYPSDMEEYIDGVAHEDTWREFSYHGDEKYYYLFPHLKLNTKIEILHSDIHGMEDSDGILHLDDSTIGGTKGYCHLNLLQRFILNYDFNKLWFQKEGNLKWIISTIITIITMIITLVIGGT